MLQSPFIQSRQTASTISSVDGRLEVAVAVRVRPSKNDDKGRVAGALRGPRDERVLHAVPADSCIRVFGQGKQEPTVLRFGSVFGPDASQVANACFVCRVNTFTLFVFTVVCEVCLLKVKVGSVLCLK